MKIETFAQRQKAEDLYKNYFDPNGEYALDFSFFDTLDDFGAITRDDFNKLTEKFVEIGDNLWKEINKFDKNQLNKTK